MKKTLSFLVLIFMLLSFAGCAPVLPDPLPDAEAFYAREIKHIEGRAAQQMLGHSRFTAMTEGDSELLRLYHDFVATYLDDIRVSAAADGSEVNSRGRAATVRMNVSFVDMPKLMARAEDIAKIRHDTFMMTGKMPSERSDHLFLLEAMLETLALDDVERISGPQIVELIYEKNTGWAVANAEELITSFVW